MQVQMSFESKDIVKSFFAEAKDLFICLGSYSVAYTFSDNVD